MDPILGSINSKVADELEKNFSKQYLPYMWSENVSGKINIYNPSFIHIVYDKESQDNLNSPIYKSVDNLIQNHILLNHRSLFPNIEPKNYLRIRYFIQPDINIPNNYTSDPFHIDLDKPNISIVYYVNTSGGGTIIDYPNITYNVKHKKGNYVIFDGSIPHAGKISQNFTSRAVLNINILL